MFSFVPNELQIYLKKKRFLLDFLGFVDFVIVDNGWWNYR